MLFRSFHSELTRSPSMPVPTPPCRKHIILKDQFTGLPTLQTFDKAPLAKWGLLPEPRFRHIVGTQHCCLELRCLSSSPEANSHSLPDSPAGTRRQCPATEPSPLPLNGPRAFSISWAGLQISTPVLSCWESAPMFPGQV